MWLLTAGYPISSHQRADYASPGSLSTAHLLPAAAAIAGAGKEAVGRAAEGAEAPPLGSEASSESAGLAGGGETERAAEQRRRRRRRRERHG